MLGCRRDVLSSGVMFALLRAIVVVVVLASVAPSVGFAVECAKVISAISKGKRPGSRGGSDISTVAEQLDTSVAWVEHCMRVYGRRPRRPGLESAEGRENRLEALEDYEPEEAMDPEEPGEVEVRRDRSKQPKFNNKKPTPSGFMGGFN